jgi:kynurenine formamidase
MITVTQVVDLTRPISDDLAMWPGTPQPEFETRFMLERDGFYARRASLWEHTGTHIDAPAHFIAGGRSVDMLDLSALVCPAVIIDVEPACAKDPDYLVRADDVRRFEDAHGTISEGSAVLVRTGWDRLESDRQRYMGTPGDLHFPGFGEDAARLLVDERHVAGIGIDTLSTDYGAAHTFHVHGVVLGAGCWQLEGLMNLDRLPPTGSLLIIGALPLAGGSGAPARVLALL